MALVQANYYRRTHLVTRSTSKTRLITHRTCLTTRSTCSTRLFTLSTCLSTRDTGLFTRSTRFFTRSTRLSIGLFIRSTRLSIRSTRLSSHTIYLSTRNTRSTICWSFYNWLVYPKNYTFLMAVNKNFENCKTNRPELDDLKNTNIGVL